MMKRIINNSIWLLFLFTIACKETDDIVVAMSNEPISFLLKTPQKGTRANTMLDDIWTTTAKVAVCDANSNTVYPYFPTIAKNEALLQAEDSAKSFYWSSVREVRQFKAWYPYTVDNDGMPNVLNGSLNNVKVESDQSKLTPKEYQESDLLYAPLIDVNYKKSADLSFYHQLCRIIVSVNSNATSSNVTTIQLGDDNIGLSGNIKNLGVTGENNEGTSTEWEELTDRNYTVVMRNNTDLSDEGNFISAFECIIPPQSGGSYVKPLFTIKTKKTLEDETLQEKTYQYCVLYNFQAGYQYHYKLSLGKRGVIQIVSVTVSDWGSPITINDDAHIPDDYLNE